MKFLANSKSSPVAATTQRALLQLTLALAAFACAAPIAFAQNTEPATQPAAAPAPATPQPALPAQAPDQSAAPQPPPPAPEADEKESKHGKHDKNEAAEITESELKQQLVGKQLFLRGGYLGDSISFNEHGLPIGHPAVGSYTLSGVEIEKIHLSKRKVELEGARYALHFLGALPYEDPNKAVDRIKITPKKKMLRITIDREQVIKEKKAKETKESKKDKKSAPAAGAKPGTPDAAPVASAESDAPPAADTTAQKSAPEATPAEAPEPASEQAADPASVTSTTSPAHAAGVLRDALDRIFANGLDEKVRADMPAFWQLYYKAQAAGVDYRPSDPAVVRSSAVDTQAKLTTAIAPESNEYAQASGIAGPALYRVVIGADGKPGEIAVERPIGFGLDENAVSAIRKATFLPATQGGKPVAETLDLAVLFRIYSKRTSVAGAAEAAKPIEVNKPILPGPYTIRAPKPEPDPAPAPANAPAPAPAPDPNATQPPPSTDAKPQP